MAHRYAGVLGPLALATAVARGLLRGSSVENMLFHAWLALLAFAVIGYLIGRLAQATVEESLRASLAAQPDTGSAESTTLAAASQS